MAQNQEACLTDYVNFGFRRKILFAKKFLKKTPLALWIKFQN